jgi:3D (Asp-Asp-Asp) domain-containing protein
MKSLVCFFIISLFCLIWAGCSGTSSKGKRASHSGAKAVVAAPTPWNSNRHRMVKTTAYSHKENEPGAEGRKNSIGTTLRYGMVRSAAADWSKYPLGTQFRISGSPFLYEIDDYGSALVGTDTIDLFKPTLGQMKEWGVRQVNITIVKWGSFETSQQWLGKRLQYPHVAQMHRCIQYHQRNGVRL